MMPLDRLDPGRALDDEAVVGGAPSRIEHRDTRPRRGTPGGGGADLGGEPSIHPADRGLHHVRGRRARYRQHVDAGPALPTASFSRSSSSTSIMPASDPVTPSRRDTIHPPVAALSPDSGRRDCSAVLTCILFSHDEGRVLSPEDVLFRLALRTLNNA
jgi:hypothetical protein